MPGEMKRDRRCYAEMSALSVVRLMRGALMLVPTGEAPRSNRRVTYKTHRYAQATMSPRRKREDAGYVAAKRGRATQTANSSSAATCRCQQPQATAICRLRRVLTATAYINR